MMSRDAINIFKETGKEPLIIYEEHQEMLEMLKTLRLSNPDNVLLRNLIKKVSE